MKKKFSNFSDRLEGCMSRMGLNQVELAAKLGISQSVISGWLRNRNEPNLPMLVKLSKYFQISLAELTGLDSLKVIEKDAESVTNLSDEEKAVLEAYHALPEDDWKKKAIDKILLKTDKEVKKKKDSGQ